MIDERTRQMIEMYLPNPPDPELNDGEYYYLQSTMKGEQVIKVYPPAALGGCRVRRTHPRMPET